MADQTIQFSLLSGLDTRTDRHSQALGSLDQAVNVVFDKTGAVRKRHGNVGQGNTVIAPNGNVQTGIGPGIPVGGATIPASPYGYLTRVGEQNIAAGHRLYTYSPDQGDHVSKDDFPECVGTRRPLASSEGAPFGLNSGGLTSATGYYNPDVAISSDGYTCYVWQGVGTGGSINAVIYDKSNGGGHGPIVYGPVSIKSPLDFVGINPRVVAVGTAFVIVWTDTDGNIASHVYGTTIVHSASGWAGLTVGTLLSTYAIVTIPIAFDLVTDGTTFTIATAESQTSILLQAFPPDLTQSNVYTSVRNVTLAAGSGTTGEISNIALTLNGTNLWAFWAETTGASSPICVGIVTYSTFAVVLAAQAVTGDIIGPSAVGGVQVSYLAATASAGTGVYLVGWNKYALTRGPLAELVSTAGVATPPPLFSNTYPGPDAQLTPVSRPILRNGKLYLMVWLASTLQGSWFWIDMNVDGTFDSLGGPNQGPRVVCVLAPRLAPFFARGDGSLVSCVLKPDGTYITPIGVTLGNAGFAALTGRTPAQGQQSLWEATINFAHPNLALGSTLGRQTLAQSSIYDGRVVSELGFFSYPEGYTGAPQVGGSMTPSSTYQYALIWEWTTTAGELVQSTTQASATSQVLSVSLSGSQHGVVLTLSALSGGPWLSTNKTDNESRYAAPPTLAIYRTQAGGTSFTRVAGLGNNTLGGSLDYQTTYTDTASDASIASNVELYFTPGFPGGVLDNICPPSFSHTITALGAVWGIGDDLRTVWVSKPYVEGGQPGFNELLTTTIEDGGDLVALGFLNQNVIAFTSTRTYITYGQNPGATGTAAPMYQFQPIQSDVGCIDPRSLVTIPDGLVFLSPKGLCCLGQDMSVNYLDAPEDIILKYPNLTSAVLVPEHHEARFELNNGSSGVTLVLNYWAPPAAYRYKWSTFQKFDSLGSAASCIASAAGYVGGYRWAASTGYSYAEDTGGATYMDGGTSLANWVTATVQTGWLSVSGIVGYQRGKRWALSGDWYTSHDLTLQTQTDFNDATVGPFGQSALLTSSAFQGGPLTRAAVGIQYQKHEAVRLTVIDAYPTGADATVGTGRGFSLSGFSLRVQPKAGYHLVLPRQRA